VVVTRLIYTLAFLVIAGGLLYHFAALETFNLLVPKDKASARVQRDVAYGPAPRNVLDVYAPTNSQGPWPVIVFVHGGSWRSGSKAPYEFVGRALAAQGFLTLVISYRLHPQDPYPVFVQDTALALDWATRHTVEFGGDQKRIFAMGHSAGAYNVAQAILDKHYLERLGTDISAIKGVATLAGPSDFLPLDSAISVDVFGNVPNLPDTQPINHVHADAPPFLLLHGTEDTTCRPRNSINLDKALRAAGASSTLKLYQGVSHVGIMLAMAKPLRGLAPTLGDVTAFFRSQP
jgi:acetyl esterase/lipase